MSNGLSEIAQGHQYGFFIKLVQAGYPYLPLFPIIAIFVLCIVGLPGKKPTDETSGANAGMFQFRRVAAISTVAGVGILLVYFAIAHRVLTPDSARWLQNSLISLWWPVYLAATLLGIVINVSWRRYGVTRFSQWLRDMRINTSDEQLSDIRDEKTQKRTFDPREFYRDGVVFTGMKEDGNPIYIPNDVFHETHKCVVGATRFGKGVAFQSWIDQSVERGDCIFFIDPKGDKWLPRVMRESCEKHNRGFLYVDLNDDGHGSWDPFLAGTHQEQIVRALEVLNLKERGSDADFYKSLSSGVVGSFFRKTTDRPTLRNMAFNLMSYCNTEDEQNAVGGPISRLQAMATRRGLNPKQGRGLNIEHAIANNHVVYIVGSIDDDIIKLATRAVIIDVLQTAKRIEHQRKTPLTFFIDELRFLVSDTVTTALATAAGRNINLNLAFQNLGDLEQPDDRTLNGQAVRQSVLANCQVKLFFGGKDADTAEYVSESTGTIIKKIAYEKTDHTSVGGEIWQSGRMMRDVDEALIPVNKVLMLPPSTAVLFTPSDLAEVITVSPIPVGDADRPMFVKHKPAETDNSSQAAKPTPKKQKKRKAGKSETLPLFENEDKSAPKKVERQI